MCLLCLFSAFIAVRGWLQVPFHLRPLTNRTPGGKRPLAPFEAAATLSLPRSLPTFQPWRCRWSVRRIAGWASAPQTSVVFQFTAL